MPQLKPRLRRFLVALVVGLGMSAREALAQVRGARPMAGRRHQAAAPATAHSTDFLGMVVAQMPEYKHGGWAGAQQFIATHAQYPATARRTGRVMVGFTIDEKGSLQHPRILKGLEPVLDAKALRVVKLLRGFEPGRQSGRPVAVAFALPITFLVK